MSDASNESTFRVCVFCVTQHKGAPGSGCTITQSRVFGFYLVFHIKRTKVTGAVARSQTSASSTTAVEACGG